MDLLHADKVICNCPPWALPPMEKSSCRNAIHHLFAKSEISAFSSFPDLL